MFPMFTTRCSPVPQGTGEHPRLHPLVAGALVLLAAFVTLLAGPARPAYAHAQLVSSDPANGARLATAPSEIVLRFSERVNLVRDGIRLLNSDGTARPTAPPQISPTAPAEVHLPVPASLGTGAYTVSWRVVSADSHPIRGALLFAIGDAPFTSVPGNAAGADGDGPLSTVFWLFRWLGYGSLALLAGGVAFLLLCWPAGWADRRVRRILATGWAGSAACAIGVLLMQGPYAAGRSLAGTADPALLGATLATDYGHFVVARVALLAAGGLLLLRERTRPAAGVVLVLTLPATWSGTGHANAQLSVLSGAADAAHLAAMAVWLGGLALLALCVLPQESPPATAVTRFSRVAMVCVAVLVATGTYQAWRGIGSLDAVSGTAYGRLLVFKLAAVGLLVSLGAVSRSAVRRRYLLPVVQAAARTTAARAAAGRTTTPAGKRSGNRADRDRDLLTRQQLRRSVRGELLIAVAVLGLTAVLVATPPGARPEAAGQPEGGAQPQTTTQPPTTRPPTTPQPGSTPITKELSFPGGRVQLRFDPATTALNLGVRKPDGSAWDVPEVTAVADLPEHGLGPLPVPVGKVAPGDYFAPRVVIGVPGNWRLRVNVRTSEIDQFTVEAVVPVT
jgi:copper transport protein